MESDSAPTTPSPAAPTVAALIELVAALLAELHAGAPGLPAVTPASVLDRDLGLDSLARMELLLRIERAFAVALPEDSLQRADTVADLWLAVQRARPGAPAGAIAPP
ncbi:MAG: acyl carrier protein, partial [Alphaproteobacteria bacterium]|nr:acyl carrier protein [Alphaproteobacteria bacterium]